MKAKDVYELGVILSVILSPVWLGVPLASIVYIKFICWMFVCTNVVNWWTYIGAVLAPILFITGLVVLTAWASFFAGVGVLVNKLFPTS